MSAAAGSPPPSSSTTIPGPRLLQFVGSIPDDTAFPRGFVVGLDDDLSQGVVCEGGDFGELTGFVFQTDLAGLGTATIQLLVCVEVVLFEPVLVVSDGRFRATTAAGSVTATLTGLVTLSAPRDFPPFEDDAIHLDLMIISGTGEFAGATGTGVIDAMLHDELLFDPPRIETTIFGSIAGSFQVP